jgi:hypothetical protein
MNALTVGFDRWMARVHHHQTLMGPNSSCSDGTHHQFCEEHWTCHKCGLRVWFMKQPELPC